MSNIPSTSKGKAKASSSTSMPAPDFIPKPKPKPKPKTSTAKSAYVSEELTSKSSKGKGKEKAPDIEVIDVDAEPEPDPAASKPKSAPPKPARIKGMSFETLSRCIIDFIEVATHTILYIRGVYPPAAFVRRQRWQTPVWQSEHPELNKYIRDALMAILHEMEQGKVKKVVIVLKNGMDIGLERWIFAVHTMLELESWNVDQRIADGITPDMLAQHFRAFMMKLCMTESSLEPLDLGEYATFTILMEMRDKTTPDVDKREYSPWVPATESFTSAGQGDGAETQVLRALNTGVINLSLAVQETEDKAFLEEQKKRAEEEKEMMKEIDAARDEEAQYYQY